MALILVIDDEDIVRKSICKMLEAEGHKVHEARTGLEGISRFKQQPPDVLITDILMPDKDGLEIIRELSADCPKVKILAITGGGATGNLDFLRQAKAFGAHATLRKPFMRDELLDSLAQLM